MMTNKKLPDDPDEMITLIRNSEDPWSTALACSRELMLLTHTDKKNYWYKAEINLLTLILLYVSAADNFVPLSHVREVKDSSGNNRSAREVADYICSPQILKERIEAALAADPYKDGDMLRRNYLIWSGSPKRLSDSVAANLAVESEVVEYLLGKTKDKQQ